MTCIFIILFYQCSSLHIRDSVPPLFLTSFQSVTKLHYWWLKGQLSPYLQKLRFQLCPFLSFSPKVIRIRHFKVISEIHFSHFNCDIHSTLVCTPCQPYVQSYMKGSGHINFNCQPSWQFYLVSVHTESCQDLQSCLACWV